MNIKNMVPIVFIVVSTMFNLTPITTILLGFIMMLGLKLIQDKPADVIYAGVKHQLKRGTTYSAGLDLFALKDTILKPGERKLIDTGVFMNIPMGFYGQIFARSSMAMQEIDVGAGVIDCDYDKEIKVLLINNSSKDFIINKDDKIAQMVIIKIYDGIPVYVDKIEESNTRNGGFGSTGKK